MYMMSFSALVYARVVAPLSKHQTFHDILQKLYVLKKTSVMINS